MLDRADLHGYETQRRIDLGPPLGTTAPDFFYADPEIYTYPDGLSARLTGNLKPQRETGGCASSCAL